MHRWSCLLALCTTFLFYISVTTATEEVISGIVQHQQWFSEYASILEETMQIKRRGNSNATLSFNKELLKLLANATIEMRSIDNTTESAIIQSDSIGQPCRALLLEMFKIFRTIGQAELQGCAANTVGLLGYWTTQRFFSFANIVHRDATELTHRVALILEEYNKLTQKDNILEILREEYYQFNSYNSALQEVLNRELERFARTDHPVRAALSDCLNTTVKLHQLDMDYVLTYIDTGCVTL
uniref:Secreted protein n=1 Tax=Anopheles christyi TaxID=43041 RepID=A0A182KJ79_9DIPT